MTTRSQSFKEEYTTFGKKQIKAEILEEEEEKMRVEEGSRKEEGGAKEGKKVDGEEVRISRGSIRGLCRCLHVEFLDDGLVKRISRIIQKLSTQSENYDVFTSELEAILVGI